MFEIGDEIVHIGNNDGDETPQHLLDYLEAQCGKIKWPIIDNVYTVRGYNSGDGLLLVEIVHPIVRWPDGTYDEIGFDPDEFVKLSSLTECTEAVEEVKQILTLELV